VQMFPESGVAGNTSFSAPSVNHAGPTAGFIFYGPARNNGMYRIDPANIPAGDGPANVWFDHTPPGNWRTNGAFSQDGSKVFMGSANGLVFSLDTAAEDPVVDGVNWVFDTITGALDETLWPFEPDPGGAGNPVPLNGAIDVSRASDIAWTSSAGATSHDVYFGTDNPPAFIGNQAAASFDPGVLAAGTTYYWRIDEVSAQGTTTGDTWSFTTEAAIDTDGDGLDDWYETMVLGTNPGSVDSDGDGLVDGAGGVVSTSTYPAGIDIDADGFVDGEQDFGTDAAVSNLGDVAPRNNLDNLIDLGDLLVLTRLVTGTVLPGGLEMINGDINGDTRLDAADILLLQQALLNGTAP